MAYADRHLADDEQLIHATRQHWTQLFGEFAVLCVTWIVAGALLWLIPPDQTWGRIAVGVVLLLALVVSVRYWLVPLLKWRGTVYLVTSKRVYKRAGLFTKTDHSIPLLRVNDVSSTATLGERLLREGTLVIQSASEHGSMTLRHVPRPQRLKNTIYEAVDREQAHLQQPAPPSWNQGYPPAPYPPAY